MRLLSFISSLFKRHPKSVLERLEELESTISKLESTRLSSIDTEKRFVFRLFVYSFILFGVGFIVVYYYWWPTSQLGKAALWTSFFVYPSAVSLLKWAFHAFFLKQVSKADELLKTLRADKQRILENVMETETFNKAQQILRRFDPLMFAKLTVVDHAVHAPARSMSTSDGISSVLRHRQIRGPDGDTTSASQTPLRRFASKDVLCSDPLAPVAPSLMDNRDPNVKPRLLRPLLPRERSFFDRILDLLVGDGPDKRYALICQECAAHNGMALHEEFEYLAFRCGYCSHFNPPRRTWLKTPVPSNVVNSPTIRPAFSSESIGTPSRLRDHTPTATSASDRERSVSPASSTPRNTNSLEENGEFTSGMSVTIDSSST